MFRLLMVRRWNRSDADRISRIFHQHDKETDLPEVIGVTRRTLFGFHDLYLHLVEGEDDFQERLYAAVNDQRFRVIDDQLAKILAPYIPNAPSMAQAQATPFYEWKRPS